MRFGNGTPFNCLMYPVGFELDQRILEQPLHWRKPQVIATQWLGDLFHEQIPITFVDEILEIIRKAKQHTFLVLTKRPQNFSGSDIKNLWLGVSISTQKEADEKIPILLQTPAAHRYINLEPMLEEINLDFNKEEPDNNGCYEDRRHGINWVLMGTESGPGRRPMRSEWARSIAGQCKAADVKLRIKQLDINGKVSKKMNEWPEDLRIRESSN